MQYAVIVASGRQHVVREKTRLTISRLPGESGAIVEFPKLIEFDTDGNATIGQPLLPATALATIVAQTRSRKVRLVKFKPKVRYRRKIGHRHPQTTVEITRV